MMTPIPKCAIDLICKFEGYHNKLEDGRAQAYADPRVGWEVPTIGWGTTRYPDGSKVRQGDVITPEFARQCLLHEMEQTCRKKLEAIPTWLSMNDNQRGALYSFAYNLGANFYKRSGFASITRVVDSPERWEDVGWITAQFEKYRNPGTKVEEGLRRRRLAEATLFCTPV